MLKQKYDAGFEAACSRYKLAKIEHRHIHDMHCTHDTTKHVTHCHDDAGHVMHHLDSGYFHTLENNRTSPIPSVRTTYPANYLDHLSSPAPAVPAVP